MKKMVTFDQWKKNALLDPEIKREYDKLEPEMRVIHAIIEARMLSDLTQQDLATKMGTQQSVISRVETGQSSPTLQFLTKLATALHAQLEIRFVSIA